MSDPPSPDALRDELEAYYRPLLPLWDRTLAGRGDRDLWRWAAGTWAGRPALEAGAGSGRITEVLAEGPAPLVALDLDLNALRRARRRLAGRPRVHLLLADMRRFRLDTRFALVACANDPFSHLRTDEGRSAALARIADHLAPDGSLILDALWFSEARRRRAAAPGGLTSEDRVPADDGDGPEILVRQTWRCDPETARCTARYEVRRGDEAAARSDFVGRYWTREELERRLAEAGLRVDRLWGGYDRSGWSPDSEHLVAVASPA